MGYYDKLVGLITRYILDYTNPSPYLTNQLSFFGECTVDDYYRLEFSLPIAMNMWPKSIHARDSTTNYAIIYDYYSGQETTQAWILTIKFDPDSSNCDGMAYLSPPIVSYSSIDTMTNPTDNFQLFTAKYLPQRDSFLMLGSTRRFKSTEMRTTSVGLITGIPIASIPAGTSITEIQTTRDILKLEQNSDFFDPPTGYTPNYELLTITTMDSSLMLGFPGEDACYQKLTSSESLELFKYEPTSTLYGFQSEGNEKIIPLSSFMASQDPTNCPITSCKLLQYPNSDAIYTDQAAHALYDQEVCKYEYSGTLAAVLNPSPGEFSL